MKDETKSYVWVGAFVIAMVAALLLWIVSHRTVDFLRLHLWW